MFILNSININLIMMLLCVWFLMPVFVGTVGIMKQPTAESSEFTMSSEDFPALPGTGGGSSSGEGVTVTGLHGAVGSEKAERVGNSTVSPPPSVPPQPDGPSSQPLQPPSVPPSTTLATPTSTTARAPGSEKHSQKRGIQTSPDGKAPFVLFKFIIFTF